MIASAGLPARVVVARVAHREGAQERSRRPRGSCRRESMPDEGHLAAASRRTTLLEDAELGAARHTPRCPLVDRPPGVRAARPGARAARGRPPESSSPACACSAAERRRRAGQARRHLRPSVSVERHRCPVRWSCRAAPGRSRARTRTASAGGGEWTCAAASSPLRVRRWRALQSRLGVLYPGWHVRAGRFSEHRANGADWRAMSFRAAPKPLSAAALSRSPEPLWPSPPQWPSRPRPFRIPPTSRARRSSCASASCTRARIPPSRSPPARRAGARSTWRSAELAADPKAKHPSTAWRREFSLLLGLERLLSE